MFHWRGVSISAAFSSSSFILLMIGNRATTFSFVFEGKGEVEKGDRLGAHKQKKAKSHPFFKGND